jgi:hypothetical protein
VKLGILTGSQLFINTVTDQLLEWLASLADFDRKIKDMEKGKKIWTKTMKNPDPDYSYRFYYLLMECLDQWPEGMPHDAAYRKKFDTKRSSLRK